MIDHRLGFLLAAHGRIHITKTGRLRIVPLVKENRITTENRIERILVHEVVLAVKAVIQKRGRNPVTTPRLKIDEHHSGIKISLVRIADTLL